MVSMSKHVNFEMPKMKLDFLTIGKICSGVLLGLGAVYLGFLINFQCFLLAAIVESKIYIFQN